MSFTVKRIEFMIINHPAYMLYTHDHTNDDLYFTVK